MSFAIITYKFLAQENLIVNKQTKNIEAKMNEVQNFKLSQKQISVRVK